MTKDQKTVENTLDLSIGSPSPAPTISSMESVKDSVTLSARLRVACSPELMESLGGQHYRRFPEESLASTLSMPSGTREAKDRCPVSGERVPSVEQIAESLKSGIVVGPGWPWTLEETAYRIAVNLRHWALKYGLKQAAHMGRVVFEQPVCVVRVEGEQVNDERERHSGSDGVVGSDRLLLQGDRSVPEGDAGGSSSRGPAGGGHSAGCVGGSGARGQLLAFPARRDARHKEPSGISHRGLTEEIAEAERDIAAFRAAHAVIHERVLEDEQRLLKLGTWSGTAAVLGTLDLAIHAIEQVRGEMLDILERVDAGEIPNTDEG